MRAARRSSPRWMASCRPRQPPRCARESGTERVGRGDDAPVAGAWRGGSMGVEEIEWHLFSTSAPRCAPSRATGCWPALALGQSCGSGGRCCTTRHRHGWGGRWRCCCWRRWCWYRWRCGWRRRGVRARPGRGAGPPGFSCRRRSAWSSPFRCRRGWWRGCWPCPGWGFRSWWRCAGSNGSGGRSSTAFPVTAMPGAS